MNTGGKKRKINRYGIPRQANKTFHVGNLLASIILAVFEVATNRLGVLFILDFGRKFIAPSQVGNYDFWGNILAIGAGLVPLFFLVNLWFKYGSGHYERKHDIHTEKLQDHDRGYEPEGGVAVALHWIGIIIPFIIAGYGFGMDWLGVYNFFGHLNLDLMAEQDKWFFWAVQGMGFAAACISTYGTPNFFFTAWDMKDEANIQERRHTVDLQKQTPVPEKPGLFDKLNGVGSGKQIAAPKSKTTTI